MTTASADGNTLRAKTVDAKVICWLAALATVLLCVILVVLLTERHTLAVYGGFAAVLCLERFLDRRRELARLLGDTGDAEAETDDGK